MKKKELRRVLRENWEETMPMIGALVRQNDSYASTQRQRDEAEHWSPEEAKEFSDRVEECGKSMAFSQNMRNMQMQKGMNKIESSTQKMCKKINRRLDHAEKTGKKNKDDIAKQRDQIAKLVAELQKRKTKRKEMKKEIAVLRDVIIDIAIVLQLAVPGDSPMEIHKRFKNIYGSRCRDRIRKKGVLDYIDVDCREVENDD